MGLSARKGAKRGRSKLLKVVLDTNVFVSAIILRRGNPFEVVEAWRHDLFVLLLSEEQREELEDVLQREEVGGKYRVPADEIKRLLNLLRATTVTIRSGIVLPLTVRDTEDQDILGLAVEGDAHYLVTGDRDLLVLRDDPRLGQLKIVTAREFLEVLHIQ